MKIECLTIGKTLHSQKRTYIETITYELLSTESGNIRLIQAIEKEKLGRKTTYRMQTRRMDLETGHYLNHYDTWDTAQPEKYKALIEEWACLPYHQTFKCRQFETRYFKNVTKSNI